MSGLTTRRLLCVLALSASTCRIAANAAEGFDVVADVPLPGDTSRFDYESLDVARHLLFIAHLGASEVLAFDTRTRTVVGRIKNLSQVHGVLVIPELERVYASATGTNEVVAIDESSFAVVARTPGGTYPDGMAYAPRANKLYVSDETGKTETVIDVSTHQRVATIALGGEVGNTQYDPVSRHIFVNVQSRNDLVEIDPGTDRIVRRIHLPGAEGNHGLLIDAASRRAFIVCEGNDRLLVLNMETRDVENTFSVGRGPDVLAEDQESSSIYVASESGVVSAFQLGNGRVSKSDEGFLASNAHVVAIDADHLGYFPIRNLSGHPVLRIVNMTKRPSTEKQ